MRDGGMNLLTGRSFPRAMGHDFAAVGAGITRLKAGDAVLGRAAAQFAQARGASVAGSCRDPAAGEAHVLGVGPVVGFGSDPAALTERFDLVLDPPGTLPSATARTLLKPGGTIIDIVPTPATVIRSALSGPFRASGSWSSLSAVVVFVRAARARASVPHFVVACRVGRRCPWRKSDGNLLILEERPCPKSPPLTRPAPRAGWI